MKTLNPKSITLGVSLIACIAANLILLPMMIESRAAQNMNADLDETTIYHYETSLSTGASGDDSIRLSYDPVSSKLLVAIFENGDAAAYTADNVSNPVGEFVMQNQSTYNDSSSDLYAPVNSITLTVNSMDTNEAEFSVTYSSTTQSKYVAPKVEENDLQHRYGVCSNPNGTGACDQVHTNRDWWRCFICCFYGGGCGA